MTDTELGVLLYHAAPLTKHDDTGPSRNEGAAALTSIVDATRDNLDGLLIAADWNHDGDAVNALRRATDGELVGSLLDGIIAAGLTVVRSGYTRSVGRVRLGTDHPKGALRVVVRRKGRLLARRRVVWLYNIRVGRDGRQVAREVEAMLNARGTFLVLLTEASGYNLPRVASHWLIRDRDKPERANLAAYVKRGHLADETFVDLEKTWKATERAGQHDPRAILAARVRWDRRR